MNAFPAAAVDQLPAELADELAARLIGGSPPILLDVRWTLAGRDRAGYLAGHMPGALFVDLDGSWPATAGPAAGTRCPTRRTCRRLCARLGLDDDSRWWCTTAGAGLSAAPGLVVVALVGAAPTCGCSTAAARPGSPDRPGPPSPVPSAPRAPGTVTVRPGGLPVADADGRRCGWSADGSRTVGALIDVRAAARYRGEVEPLDPVAGHIPGAVNLPIADLMRADGTFRPAGELRGGLAGVGITAGVRRRSPPAGRA